jgi:methylene-tetrahydromethanopterin dehydrogenase
VLAVQAAGVQVVSPEDLAFATRLKIAADVNAVPPEGIAGVGVMTIRNRWPRSWCGRHRRVRGRQRQVPDPSTACWRHVPVREGSGVELPEAFAAAREFLAEQAASTPPQPAT